MIDDQYRVHGLYRSGYGICYDSLRHIKKYGSLLLLLLICAWMLQSAQAATHGAGVIPCSKGSAYQDGCRGASPGPAQFPSLLTTYVSPPPWNVAGVDYAVGIPFGTTLTAAVSASMPSGCAYSATAGTGSHPAVTCSSGTPVLSGIDFGANNGTQLLCTGGTPTIRNSLFVFGTNEPIGSAGGGQINISGTCSPTFLNDEMNGNSIAVTSQAGAMIMVSNNAPIVWRYNNFHHSGGDMIDYGSTSSLAHTEVFQYNLMHDIGYVTTHSDTLQWCRTKVGSSDIGFNTFYQPLSGLSGEGIITINAECSGASNNNFLVHNNTIISLTSDNWGIGATVTQDAGATGTSTNVALIDNYIDPTGIVNFTDSPWFANGQAGVAYTGVTLPQPTAMHDFISMLTGATIPVPSVASPSAFNPHYFVYPDSASYSPSLNDVYSVAASPSSGNVTTGNTVTFTLAMDEAWTITGGAPTLTLNDGGVAGYTSGSGTTSLVFTYTVGSGDSSTGLAITGLLANSATIKDPFGNLANTNNVTQTFVITINGGTPVNAVLPIITGTAISGYTLSTTTGSWTNSPTSYTYQWNRADITSPISGATSSTYTLVSGDVGHTITVTVTAVNSNGSTPATSTCL